MQKILAAFDGLKYSTSTRDHAIDLTKKTEARLVGLFLEDRSYHSFGLTDLLKEDGGGMATRRRHLEKRDRKRRARAITDFEKRGRQAGLSCDVHKDRSVAIRELLKESIYADLLIVAREENLSTKKKPVPGNFLRELLPEVQCPVMVVPAQYAPIQKLVLLFDGEPGSVYALKMLSYIFGNLKELPVDVVTVNPSGKRPFSPDRKLMIEFMEAHFPGSGYTALKGTPEKEIVKYLKKQENALVALGAYRRGRVSRWFRPSMADSLMRDLDLPLFIAHS